MYTFTEFAKEHGSYINCVWFRVRDEDSVKNNFKSVYKGKPIFATLSNQKSEDKFATLTQVPTPNLGSNPQEQLSLNEELFQNLENEIKANFKSNYKLIDQD